MSTLPHVSLFTEPQDAVASATVLQDDPFAWVPFYRALAEKILEYSERRDELFGLLRELSEVEPLLNYLHFEREDWWVPRGHNVDPFTIIGAFNRGISEENRTALASKIAALLGLSMAAPRHFGGIPVLNNMQSFFNGVDEIWALTLHVMKYETAADLDKKFVELLDRAVTVVGNGAASITMGLFWIRPDLFMPVDKNSLAFIEKTYGLTVKTGKGQGAAYLEYLGQLHTAVEAVTPGRSFPEISLEAWTNANTAKDTSEDMEPVLLGEPVEVMSGATVLSDQHDKNTILFGPPGTGKTYNTVVHAVAIIEESPIEEIKREPYSAVFERYSSYKREGLIAFTTFHQSFAYEEFVEGIRPTLLTDDIASDGRQLEYEIHSGLFKSFCDNAAAAVSGNSSEAGLGIGSSPTVWKVSLGGTGVNPVRADCLAHGRIRFLWEEYDQKIDDSTDFSLRGGRELNAFYNKMQVGDLVFSTFSSKTIDAIGVITGEPELNPSFAEYKHVRSVKWLVKDISHDVVELNAGKIMTRSTLYKLTVSATDAIDLLKELNPGVFAAVQAPLNKVFIIDEINRGNISKIFGELITLLEPAKRIGGPEELRVTLPYSGQRFGVPQNVYVLGTMNTADRSIALIDTALRRRFAFLETPPEPALLAHVNVGEINVGRLLEILNKRITVLLDREHVVGHAYFMSLESEPTIEHLARIFRWRILPLLQEYFFDDYEKIQLVLGDNQKLTDEARFLVANSDFEGLLGSGYGDVAEEYFEVQPSAFENPAAYAFLN